MYFTKECTSLLQSLGSRAIVLLYDKKLPVSTCRLSSSYSINQGSYKLLNILKGSTTEVEANLDHLNISSQQINNLFKAFT